MLIIGHRGFCAVAPENTLPSFGLALEARADLVELDYHHSKDGIPVVIHDHTLDRTTDSLRKWKRRRIKVAEKTAAELQTLDAGSWFESEFAGSVIPLLTEALDFICDKSGVALIEHKSGDAATLAGVLRSGNWINRVVVISFDWRFLRELHKLEPEQILGALGPPTFLPGGRKPVRISRPLRKVWLDELAKTGAKIVLWNRRVSRKAIQTAQQRGLKVWVYTINTRRLANRLISIGVQGLITNKPGLLLDIVRK